MPRSGGNNAWAASRRGLLPLPFVGFLPGSIFFQDDFQLHCDRPVLACRDVSEIADQLRVDSHAEKFGAALLQDNDDLAIVLNADGSWSESGVWETTDPPNPMGVTINDFADDLGSATVGMAVPLYFNVHTSEFGAGEIRGQLVAIADDIGNVVTGTTGNDVLFGTGGNDGHPGLGGGRHP